MPEQKSILLVTRPIAPPWDEASKNFAYYLARNVAGINFTLLTHGNVPGLPQHVIQQSIYTSNDFNALQKAWLFFALLKNRDQFGVFHSLFTPTKQNVFFLRQAIKGTRAKTIQTIATLREDLYSDAQIKKLLFADLIITYSDYAKNKLEKLGFGNVRRVYPGIDLEYYSPKPKDQSVLEKLGLSNDEFVVTYPGEFVRLGATDALVEMIVANRNLWRERKVRFVLACRVKNDADQKKKKEVVSSLEKSHCSDLVNFTDTFSDMPKLFNISDVIIFPVRNMEGKFDVPLAAIEPMACGKPVIVSDLPILKEFANEKNSMTIDRQNFDTLKEAILKLQDNPALASAMGNSGRLFVEENFDIRKIAEQYQKIYEQI